MLLSRIRELNVLVYLRIALVYDGSLMFMDAATDLDGVCKSICNQAVRLCTSRRPSRVVDTSTEHTFNAFLRIFSDLRASLNIFGLINGRFWGVALREYICGIQWLGNDEGVFECMSSHLIVACWFHSPPSYWKLVAVSLLIMGRCFGCWS